MKSKLLTKLCLFVAFVASGALFAHADTGTPVTLTLSGPTKKANPCTLGSSTTGYTFQDGAVVAGYHIGAYEGYNGSSYQLRSDDTKTYTGYSNVVGFFPDGSENHWPSAPTSDCEAYLQVTIPSGYNLTATSLAYGYFSKSIPISAEVGLYEYSGTEYTSKITPITVSVSTKDTDNTNNTSPEAINVVLEGGKTYRITFRPSSTNTSDNGYAILGNVTLTGTIAATAPVPAPTVVYNAGTLTITVENDTDVVKYQVNGGETAELNGTVATITGLKGGDVVTYTVTPAGSAVSYNGSYTVYPYSTENTVDISVEPTLMVAGNTYTYTKGNNGYFGYFAQEVTTTTVDWDSENSQEKTTISKIIKGYSDGDSMADNTRFKGELLEGKTLKIENATDLKFTIPSKSSITIAIHKSDTRKQGVILTSPSNVRTEIDYSTFEANKLPDGDSGYYYYTTELTEAGTYHITRSTKNVVNEKIPQACIVAVEVVVAAPTAVELTTPTLGADFQDTKGGNIKVTNYATLDAQEGFGHLEYSYDGENWETLTVNDDGTTSTSFYNGDENVDSEVSVRVVPAAGYINTNATTTATVTYPAVPANANYFSDKDSHVYFTASTPSAGAEVYYMLATTVDAETDWGSLTLYANETEVTSNSQICIASKKDNVYSKAKYSNVATAYPVPTENYADETLTITATNGQTKSATYTIDGGAQLSATVNAGVITIPVVQTSEEQLINYTITPQSGTIATYRGSYTVEGIAPTTSYTYTYDNTGTYFAISGNNNNKTGISAIYNGETYTKFLKVENSTILSFTSAGFVKVKIALYNGFNCKVAIDGIDVEATKIEDVTDVYENVAHIVEYELGAGNHTIKRASTKSAGAGTAEAEILFVTVDEIVSPSVTFPTPVLNTTHSVYKDDAKTTISNYSEFTALAGFDHLEYSYDQKNWNTYDDAAKLFIYGAEGNNIAIKDATAASYTVYARPVAKTGYVVNGEIPEGQQTYPGVPAATVYDKTETVPTDGNLYMTIAHADAGATIKYVLRDADGWTSDQTYGGSQTEISSTGKYVKLCVKATDTNGITSAQVYYSLNYPNAIKRMYEPIVTVDDAAGTFKISVDAEDPNKELLGLITYDVAYNSAEVAELTETSPIYTNPVAVDLSKADAETGKLTLKVNAIAVSADKKRALDSSMAEFEQVITVKKQRTPLISMTAFGVVRINPPRESETKLYTYPAGTVLRYTIDGSDPATSATAETYTAEFQVLDGTTIKACALAQGFYTLSDVAEDQYFNENEGATYNWWVVGNQTYHDPLSNYTELSNTVQNDGKSEYAGLEFGYVYVLETLATAGGDLQFENNQASVITVVQAQTRAASNGNPPALAKYNTETRAWEMYGSFETLNGVYVDDATNHVRIWTISVPDTGLFSLCKASEGESSNNYGKLGIVYVSVKYAQTGAQLNTPTITINGGAANADGTANVRITCAGATHIWYTTDGTDPKVSYNDATDEVTVNTADGSTKVYVENGAYTDASQLIENVADNTTIKAVAWCNNKFYTISDVATQVIYTDKILKEPKVSILNGSVAIKYPESTAAFTNFKIQYIINGAAAVDYERPFTVLNNSTIRVRVSADDAVDEIVEVTVPACPKKAYDSRAYFGAGAFDLNNVTKVTGGNAIEGLDSKEYPGAKITVMTDGSEHAEQAYSDTAKKERIQILCNASETGQNTEGQRRGIYSPSGKQVKLSRGNKKISRVLLYTVLMPSTNGNNATTDKNEPTYISEVCGVSYKSPVITLEDYPAAATSVRRRAGSATPPVGLDISAANLTDDSQKTAVELTSTDASNPDLRIFDVTDPVTGLGVDEVTFTVTGNDIAYVAVLEVGDGEPIKQPDHFAPEITFKDWQVYYRLTDEYDSHDGHYIVYTIDGTPDITSLTLANKTSTNETHYLEYLRGQSALAEPDCYVQSGVAADQTLVNYRKLTEFRAMTINNTADALEASTITRVSWSLRNTPVVNFGVNGTVEVVVAESKNIVYKVFAKDVTATDYPFTTALTLDLAKTAGWETLYDGEGTKKNSPQLTEGQTIAVVALGDGTNYGHSLQVNETYWAIEPPVITFEPQTNKDLAETTIAAPDGVTYEPGDQIYYTTDGTNPRTSATAKIYSGASKPIVDNGTLVRAVVVRETATNTIYSGVSQNTYINENGTFHQWWMEDSQGMTDDKNVFPDWNTQADNTYGTCVYRAYSASDKTIKTKQFPYVNRIEKNTGLILFKTTEYSKITIVQNMNAPTLPAIYTYSDEDKGYVYTSSIQGATKFSTAIDETLGVKISTFYVPTGRYKIDYDTENVVYGTDGDVEYPGIVYMSVASAAEPKVVYIVETLPDGKLVKTALDVEVNSNTEKWTATFPNGIQNPWIVVYGDEETILNSTTFTEAGLKIIEQKDPLVDHYNNDVLVDGDDDGNGNYYDDGYTEYTYRSNTETVVYLTINTNTVETAGSTQYLYIRAEGLIDIYLDITNSSESALKTLGWIDAEKGVNADAAFPYVHYRGNDCKMNTWDNGVAMHIAGGGGYENSGAATDANGNPVAEVKAGLYEFALPAGATSLRFSHVSAADKETMIVIPQVKAASTRAYAASSTPAIGELEVTDGGVVVIPNHVYIINGDGNLEDDRALGEDGNSDVTGVETIVNDVDEDTVYYNLQGIRVENPAKGVVYIVIRNGVPTKVLVR